MAVRLFHSIFVHTPKTGGTWVRAVLREMGLDRGEVGRDHATPAELADKPAYLHRAVVFTFVRHPLSWYQSYWAYRMKNGWHRASPGEVAAPIRTVSLDATCRDDDFERFVRNCLRRYPKGWVTHLYDHYTRGCTFIGRQERLREDLLFALTLAGEPVNVEIARTYPAQNVASGDEDLKSQCRYPGELAREVAAVERSAMARWGYAVGEDI